jgi:hypothetical protein
MTETPTLFGFDQLSGRRGDRVALRELSRRTGVRVADILSALIADAIERETRRPGAWRRA